MRLILALIGLALVLGFQNCSKTSFQQGAAVLDSENPPEKTTIETGTTAQYTVIKQIHIPHEQIIKSIKVDLVAGVVVYSDVNGYLSCRLDDSRYSTLQTIINEASICEPKPLPEGVVSCQAIGQEDFILANNTHTVTLSPFVCNYGRDLCGDYGKKLRSLFDDLVQNRATDCLEAHH